MEMELHQKIGQARQWLEQAFADLVHQRQTTDSMRRAAKLDAQLERLRAEIYTLQHLEAELALDLPAAPVARLKTA